MGREGRRRVKEGRKSRSENAGDGRREVQRRGKGSGREEEAVGFRREWGDTDSEEDLIKNHCERVSGI